MYNLLPLRYKKGTDTVSHVSTFLAVVGSCFVVHIVVVVAVITTAVFTFKGVLINDQQTASLHFVAKCDAVGSPSVS